MGSLGGFSALNAMFTELDTAVADFGALDRISAEDALSYVTEDGGNIQLVESDGDFSVTHEPVRNIREWEDPWPVTYGLDGSTTRTLSFNNGLMAVGSVAKFGVSGSTDKADFSNYTTANVVAHLNDDEFTLDGVEQSNFDLADGTTAELLQFPQSNRMSRFEDYIMGFSRTYAESKHAQLYASELDGPLFIDGSVYPNPTFGWLLFKQSGTGPSYIREDWGEWVDTIMQNYISTIESLYENDYPPIGIIKTGQSAATLNALEAKLERAGHDLDTPLRWSNDHKLFNDALYTRDDRYGDDGNIISYTPWLLQMKELARDQYIVPFRAYGDIDLAFGTASEYRRAFFYVRCPMTNTVMRVETPYIFARDAEMRERIQRKALVEVAQQQKEPRAITLADESARITRHDRNQLREAIGSVRAIEDYNEQRGFREFEEV